jgi:hypothetical protein
MQELRSETPRYSQANADFHTQAVDTTQEIAHNFLDSQKDVISSIRSVWTPLIERTTTNNIIGTPFFSPQQK